QLSLYVPPGKGRPHGDDIPTIELPRLKKLRIFCHSLQSHIIILSHMQCPEVTTLCLHFHPEYVPQSVSTSQHVENIEKLASLIAARFHVSDLDVESDPRFHIIVLQASRQASGDHRTISIRLDRVEDSNDLPLGSFFKRLPPDNIKRLWVSESAFSAGIWLPLFGSLRCLENIVLWSTPTDMISALNTRSSQDGEGEGPPSEMGALGFKALQRLTINYWNFNENNADALWACIEARHAHDVGLKVLRLQECMFRGKSTTSSNLLDRLKSVVEVVEWDVEHVSTGIVEEEGEHRGERCQTHNFYH
ncbi:hypothetical protein DXG01_014853, partial [Tephrocybe rancida]